MHGNIADIPYAPPGAHSNLYYRNPGLTPGATFFRAYGALPG